MNTVETSAVRVPGGLRSAVAAHARLPSHSAESARSGVSPKRPMDISGSNARAKKVTYAPSPRAPAARAAATPSQGTAVATKAVNR